MMKKKLFSLPLVTHDANSIKRSSKSKKELLSGQHFLSSTPKTGPQPQFPTPATLPKFIVAPPSSVQMLNKEVKFVTSTETQDGKGYYK